MASSECRQCQHFYITFEASHPYGCRLFQFKGPQMPDKIVKKTSDEECQGFKPKKIRTQIEAKNHQYE